MSKLRFAQSAALSSLLALSFAGCAMEGAEPIDELDSLASGDKADGVALQRVSRLPRDIDSTHLSSATLEGTTLVLSVSYGGGCEEHEFGLYWDGSFLESHPMQVNLKLVHNGHGDVCEAIKRKTLRFDLSSLASPDPLIVNLGGAGVSASVTLVGTPAEPELLPLRKVARLPADRAGFTVLATRVEESTLEVDVRYVGGCELNAFDLYWDRRFLESLPMQANLALVRDAEGDECDRVAEETLRFDVAELASGAPVMLNLRASGRTSTVMLGESTPPATTAKAIHTVSRLPADKDGFDIEGVRVSGRTLSVDVRYGGGCEDHEFELYWDGRLLETSPAQARLRIVHDANGDACEALRSETLTFDVSALAGSGRVALMVEGSGVVNRVIMN